MLFLSNFRKHCKSAAVRRQRQYLAIRHNHARPSTPIRSSELHIYHALDPLQDRTLFVATDQVPLDPRHVTRQRDSYESSVQ